MKPFEKIPICKPEQWLIKAGIFIGLNFSELTHEITNEFKNHSIKRHGDYKLHGTATVTTADFDQISCIVKNPDYAIIGAIRKEVLINAYAKIISSITYLYFEDILKSRRNKAMRGKTLYKVTKPLSFDEFFNNVSRNKKTDILKAWIYNSQKNVQTAGSHPGGQAETR